MNDIAVPDRNTPIFNQLKAERGYDPTFPKHYMRAGLPYSMDLPKPAQEASRGFLAPGAWIAKKVPTMAPREKNARLKVNIHPEEAEHVNTYGMEGFIRARLNEFNEKHPNAMDVVMSTKDEIDGTVTILIEGTEVPDVKLAKKPVWPVVEEPKGESFTVRGLSETMPPVFRTEPKTEKIPEDLAAHQLKLYAAVMKPHPQIVADQMEAHGLNDPEQTDESVNAASTDAPTTPQPRPLWVLDQEDADEE